MTGFHGRQVFTAGFIAPQLAATDCNRDVAVELWRTEPAPAPRWADQPAELARLSSPNQIGCPTGQIGWNVSDTIAAAVADGLDSITFGLRVNDDHQGDIAYGRTFASAPFLRLTYNTAPKTPTDLRVDRHSCAETAIVYAPGFEDHVPLSGFATDPDTNDLDVRVQVWDVADPSDVFEVVYEFAAFGFVVTYPGSLVTDGATYRWRARSEDGDGAVSEWSSPCEFTIDKTRRADHRDHRALLLLLRLRPDLPLAGRQRSGTHRRPQPGRHGSVHL